MCVVVCVALLVASLAIGRHRNVQANQDAEATLSVQVNVVNVFATVRDKKGKVASGLTKDDFTLTEDGRAQDIHYFAQDTNLPLTIGLLVDTSLSQRRVLDQERCASRAFLDRMVREGIRTKAFILALSTGKSNCCRISRLRTRDLKTHWRC